MKKTIVILLFTCFISCVRNINSDYYYSLTTNEIIKLNNNEGKLLNLVDSTNVNLRVLDQDMIKIDYVNYRYRINNDSLILYDFPDESELRNEQLVLLKFNNQKLKAKDLNFKSWLMIVNQTSKKEEQIIKIEEDLYAYYIRDKDTILGEVYNFNSSFIEDFALYKRGNYRKTIPFYKNKKELKVLLFDGFGDNKIYSLNRIE